MVVGMPHQQRQRLASPAASVPDAAIPCPLDEPLSSTSAAPALTKFNESAISENSMDVRHQQQSPILPDCATGSVSTTIKGRVKLRDVNPHLICVLCHGYFVDATSIAECLHSFCRSCIILYLEVRNYCPICKIDINSSKPHLSLKPDKTLQDIVYKLVPGLFHSEMKRRNQFYQNCPDRDLHLHPEFRGIIVDRLVYSPEDTICLSLEYYDQDREKEEWEIVGAYRNIYTIPQAARKSQGNESSGSKKYLICPAAVRILYLKKLIRLKYNLISKHVVEIFYKRESLPDDYSLMDIAYIYTWKRNNPMRLYYRIHKPVTRRQGTSEAAIPKMTKPLLAAPVDAPPAANTSKDKDHTMKDETVSSPFNPPTSPGASKLHTPPILPSSATELKLHANKSICDQIPKAQITPTAISNTSTIPLKNPKAQASHVMPKKQSALTPETSYLSNSGNHRTTWNSINRQPRDVSEVPLMNRSTKREERVPDKCDEQLNCDVKIGPSDRETKVDLPKIEKPVVRTQNKVNPSVPSVTNTLSEINALKSGEKDHLNAEKVTVTESERVASRNEERISNNQCLRNDSNMSNSSTYAKVQKVIAEEKGTGRKEQFSSDSSSVGILFELKNAKAQTRSPNEEHASPGEVQSTKIEEQSENDVAESIPETQQSLAPKCKGLDVICDKLLKATDKSIGVEKTDNAALVNVIKTESSDKRCQMTSPKQVQQVYGALGGKELSCGGKQSGGAEIHNLGASGMCAEPSVSNSADVASAPNGTLQSQESPKEQGSDHLNPKDFYSTPKPIKSYLSETSLPPKAEIRNILLKRPSFNAQNKYSNDSKKIRFSNIPVTSSCNISKSCTSVSFTNTVCSSPLFCGSVTTAKKPVSSMSSISSTIEAVVSGATLDNADSEILSPIVKLKRLADLPRLSDSGQTKNLDLKKVDMQPKKRPATEINGCPKEKQPKQMPPLIQINGPPFTKFMAANRKNLEMNKPQNSPSGVLDLSTPTIKPEGKLSSSEKKKSPTGTSSLTKSPCRTVPPLKSPLETYSFVDLYSSPAMLRQQMEYQKMLMLQAAMSSTTAATPNGSVKNPMAAKLLEDQFLKYAMHAAQRGAIPPHPLVYSHIGKTSPPGSESSRLK